MKSKIIHYRPKPEDKRAAQKLDFRPDRVAYGTHRGMHYYRLLLDGGNDSGCYIPDGMSIAKAVDYAAYWMRKKLIWSATLEVSNPEKERVTDLVSLLMIDNREKIRVLGEK